MSSIRGIGDGYAFQRLLWLLVGTVIVPTILLSLFGVMAIRNQRAAVLQELDRVRTERLEIGARVLVDEVLAVEAALKERASACTGELASCALEVRGTSAHWTWRVDEALPPALAELGVTVDLGREQAVLWVAPVDGSAPTAVLARGPARFAWRLDPGWLQDRLGRLSGERLPADASLRLAAPSSGPSTLEEVLARFGESERSEIVLQRPLAGWRLELDDRTDPTRAALQRNAWLYPASLMLLVGVVLVGTVVTLGSASREIRLSRLQTDFVSSVSHELRTPLTSIRLFVETLQSGRLQDPAKVQECLDLLAHETDRLSRMIERVLDWARMEAGRRIYEFEPVTPQELASDAIRALRSQDLLAEDPAEIEVDVPADLPEISVDRDAIVEALLNLLQNAVKYTPPPRRISLRAATRDGWVGLTVEDNGPGVAKRDRKRIFEKFYQADTRLSAPAQGRFDRGSGLGLSIVRAVTRAHHGRVELDSELGRGSRFTVWLPVTPAPR